MKIEEITLNQLDPKKFIEEKCKELSETVGEGLAVNALSGGVDSSVVTMLGHKALGFKIKTYFMTQLAEKIGNWPQEVTAQMVANFLRGTCLEARFKNAHYIQFNNLD
jgi:GMP synthase (glutamine-hydrolysing)